jgi:WD40 repeat protein
MRSAAENNLGKQRSQPQTASMTTGEPRQPAGDRPSPGLAGETAEAPARQPRPQTVEIATLLGHRRSVVGIALDPDGRLLASASSDGVVILWDLAEPDHPARTATLDLRRPRRWIAKCELAFSPDGRLLATGTTAGTVTVWDVTRPAHPAQAAALATGRSWFITHRHAVAFSPDGRLLASASSDGGVTLWDVTQPESPTLTATLLDCSFSCMPVVSFSPDGRLLATSNRDQRTTIWDISDPAHPKETDTIDDRKRRQLGLVAGRFCPTGRLLAVSRYRETAAYGGDAALILDAAAEVTLWQVNQAGEFTRIAQLKDSDSSRNAKVTGMAFNRDGRLLALGGVNGLQVWDVSDPICPIYTDRLRDRRGAGWVALNPDGRLLASTSGKTVRLWRRTA